MNCLKCLPLFLSILIIYGTRHATDIIKYNDSVHVIGAIVNVMENECNTKFTVYTQ